MVQWWHIRTSELPKFEEKIHGVFYKFCEYFNIVDELTEPQYSRQSPLGISRKDTSQRSQRI